MTGRQITGPTSQHPRGARSTRRDTPLVAVLTAAAILTVYALTAFYTIGKDRSDFSSFYRSGQAWTQGQTIYPLDRNPNLNPPLAIAVLFAPLTRLPFALAATVWVLAGLASILASVWSVRKALDLTARQTVGALAVLHVTHAAFLVWLQGQVTWILLYPLTRAWLAYRAGRPVAAGLWLAPAVAIKPILALAAVALPMRVWATAGLLSAAMAVSSLAWTGWPPWATWLRVGSEVSWIAWPVNASLWGMAARLQSGTMKGLTLRELHPVAAAAVSVVLMACLALAIRTSARDRRFTLALFWMVLASPLGWIYYLPLGLGCVTATWPPGRLAWAVIALISVPFHLVQDRFSSPLVIRTAGCMYGAAVLTAFFLWWRNGRNRPDVAEQK